MHLKIRQVHGFNVPRDLVYATLTEISPEGLEARKPIRKKKKARKDALPPLEPTGSFLWMAMIS